jgi:hypothetical protein
LARRKKARCIHSKDLTSFTVHPIIAAMLIGNNITLVIMVFFMGDLLMALIDLVDIISPLLNLLLQTVLPMLIVSLQSFAKSVFSVVCQFAY